jgi:adenylosuccinate synthase
VVNVYGGKDTEGNDIKGLLKEIAERDLDSERLKIDGQAMVIMDEDIVAESELKRRIGSTGQGVGAASARRIMRRFPGTRLAREIPELKPYICEGLQLVSEMLGSGKRVLLEGTQGTALSLYHGYYPYVTSRDTTVAGCLAEAGIAPSYVRKVLMVCRTYPIRVESPKEGDSGPMSQELTIAEIARRSGKDARKITETEITSTTLRKRRISEFDWVLLRKAALLNRPTDIALTFTDYLSAANAEARRFEQLGIETINFIQEVERVAEAPVSLITTGFSFRSVIDRRSW